MSFLLKQGRTWEAWNAARLRVKGSPVRAALHFVRWMLPAGLLMPLESVRMAHGKAEKLLLSAIEPKLAARLIRNRECYGQGGAQFRARSLRDLVPWRMGRSAVRYGALEDSLGRASGVLLSDPCCDRRLVEFCVGIPEDQYVGPAGGRDLIRRAMQGILPEPVRLRRDRGDQTDDLSIRLGASRSRIQARCGHIKRSTTVRHFLAGVDLGELVSSSLDLAGAGATRGQSSLMWILAAAEFLNWFEAWKPGRETV